MLNFITFKVIILTGARKAKMAKNLVIATVITFFGVRVRFRFPLMLACIKVINLEIYLVIARLFSSKSFNRESVKRDIFNPDASKGDEKP